MKGTQTMSSDRSRRPAWMEVDYRIGFLLCILAGSVLALAFGGWMVLFSDIADVKSRLENIRTERNAQISDVRGTMQKLDLGIDALVAKLDQVETLARARIPAGGRGMTAPDTRDTAPHPLRDDLMQDQPTVPPGR
jgi:hypothetical protein